MKSYETMEIYQLTWFAHKDINKRGRLFFPTQARAEQEITRLKNETDYTGQCINSGYLIQPFNIPIDTALGLAVWLNEYAA